MGKEKPTRPVNGALASKGYSPGIVWVLCCLALAAVICFVDAFASGN